MVRNLSNPVHEDRQSNEVVPAFLIWKAMQACLHEPDNEKDAMREAHSTALGKDLTGVFGSSATRRVIQSGSQSLFDEVKEAFFISER